MNIMLTDTTPDDCSYLTGSAYADGSEESIWFCPECARRGAKNNLLYDPASRLLVCPCQDCPGEYTHEQYAEAAFEAMFRVTQLKEELEDERKMRVRIAEMARAIEEVAA